MTRIATTGTLTPSSVFPQNQRIFRTSVDSLVAIFDTSGSPSYATSDTGSTWSAPAALPGVGTYSDLNADASATFWIGDSLYIWKITALNSPTMPRNPRVYVLPFDVATKTFGSPTFQDFKNIAVNTNAGPMAVAWDGTRFHVAWQNVAVGGARSLMLFSTTVSGTLETQQAVSYTSSSLDSLALSVYTTNLVLFIADRTLRGIYAMPYVYSGSAYVAGTASIEHVADVATTSAKVLVDAVLDSGHHQDLVYQVGATIYAVKRTSANSYSIQQIITNQARTGYAFALGQPVGTDDLYVYFESTSNATGGEIYLAKRAGTWATASRVLAAPARHPSVFRQIPGTTADLMYSEADVAGNVDYSGQAAADPPGQPGVISPLTWSSTLTPDLLWYYINAPGNPQSAFEPELYDNALAPGSSPIWAPGVTSGTTTTQQDGRERGRVTYAGPGLAWNHSYSWRVRTYDQITNTASPWSTLGTFQTVHAPEPVVDDVVSGGSTFPTSPATIPSNSFVMDVTASQADGDTLAQYQVLVQSVDGDTLETSPLRPFSPPLASGSSFSTDPFASTVMTNLQNYQLVVAVQDATTGVWGYSTPFLVSTDYPPPPSVSSFSATNQPTTGSIQFAWTLPVGDVATVVLEISRHGKNRWATVVSLPAATLTFQAQIPAFVSYDYRLRTVDSHGISDGGTTITDHALPGNGNYGVFLTDTSDRGVQAMLGAPTDWTQTQLGWQGDVNTFLPMGSSEPITSFGPATYRSQSGVQYWVPGDDIDYNGDPIIGRDVMQTFDDIAARKNTMLYTDPAGRRFYCTVTNVIWAADDPGTNYIVQFDIEQKRYRGDPL